MYVEPLKVQVIFPAKFWIPVSYFLAKIFVCLDLMMGL